MQDLAFAICASLAFLLPVGFYCLLLASINRRSKPLIVSGVWDAVGLLFGVSGFFLATMPMLIAKFYQRTLDVSDPFYSIWMQHWILWGVYFLFLFSGGALMILWRIHKTIVYNVDPDLFTKAWERTLAHLELHAAIREGRLSIQQGRVGEMHQSTEFTASAPKPVAHSHGATVADVELDKFPALSHVTLHWENYTPEIRAQIETELDRSLEMTSPLDNPAAGWFLNVSGMIFGALLMIVLAFVIGIVMSRR